MKKQRAYWHQVDGWHFMLRDAETDALLHIPASPERAKDYCESFGLEFLGEGKPGKTDYELGVLDTMDSALEALEELGPEGYLASMERQT